jgi:hypothetical protein
MIRAFLFATARHIFVVPSFCRFSAVNYRARSMNQQHSEVRIPRLAIPSRRCLSPLECCRGTRPNQAANCRPLRNTFASATAATIAVAVTGHMPSTAAIFWELRWR